MLRLKILSENRTENKGCLAEHGLSIFIETDEQTILFDAGQSDIFAMNASLVKADLTKVDAAVISHGHYDHTTGVPEFCRINDHAPVYLHHESLGERYHVGKDGQTGDNLGVLWTSEQLSAIQDRLVFTDKPVYLTSDIAISGTIDKDLEFTPTERFIVKDEDGEFRDDGMGHEQILVIRQPEGIFIFSGCSHLGVIPSIKQAQKLFPGERIAGLIAGMHLYATKSELREMIIHEILKYDIGLIIPLHCTGIDAICSIRARIGERCLLPGVGDTVTFGTDASITKCR